MFHFTGFKFQWRIPLRSLEGIFSHTENVGDRGKTVEDSLPNDDLPTESRAESIADSKIDDTITSGMQFRCCFIYFYEMLDQDVYLH